MTASAWIGFIFLALACGLLVGFVTGWYEGQAEASRELLGEERVR